MKSVKLKSKKNSEIPRALLLALLLHLIIGAGIILYWYNQQNLLQTTTDSSSKVAPAQPSNPIAIVADKTMNRPDYIGDHNL